MYCFRADTPACALAKQGRGSGMSPRRFHLDLAGMTSRAVRGQSGGFTLIELLVVIAILGLLVGLLLPAIQAAREAARRTGCVNHQSQVARAILNYETSNRHFPAGRIGCDDSGDTSLVELPSCPPGLKPEQKTAASGFVTLLPYLEQGALFNLLGVDRGGLWNRNVTDLAWANDPGKRAAVKQRVEVYVCPSDTSAPISEVYEVAGATGSYALVQGTIGPGSAAQPVDKQEAKYFNNGLFVYVARRQTQEVTDGMSRTMMLGEVVMGDTYPSINLWTYARVNADCLRTTANPLNTRPEQGEFRDGRQNGAFASEHPDERNVCICGRARGVYSRRNGLVLISGTVDLCGRRTRSIAARPGIFAASIESRRTSATLVRAVGLPAWGSKCRGSTWPARSNRRILLFQDRISRRRALSCKTGDALQRFGSKIHA